MDYEKIVVLIDPKMRSLQDFEPSGNGLRGASVVTGSRQRKRVELVASVAESSLVTGGLRR